MELSIDLLRTFAAVAETGGFTRAGQAVSLTQSAVSQQIRRLESEVGQRLFTRDGRVVRLTADGERLLPHVRKILRAHDEALAELLRPELTGRVSLGSPDDYAMLFLPGILARFARDCPLVQVEVRCLPTRDLLGEVARGEIDLAICTCALEQEGGQLVRHEPVVWVASEQHHAWNSDPIPVAFFHEGCEYRLWAEQAMAESGLRHRVAYVSPSLAGILAAVSAGLAVAPIGGSTVTPGLKVLGPAEGFPTLPTATVSLHRGRSRSSPVIDRLAEYVAEGFAEATRSDQGLRI